MNTIKIYKNFQKNGLKALGKILVLMLPISLSTISLSSCATASKKQTSLEITDTSFAQKEDGTTDIQFYLIINNPTIYAINNIQINMNCLYNGKLVDQEVLTYIFHIEPNSVEKRECVFNYKSKIHDITVDSYTCDGSSLGSSYGMGGISVASVFLSLIVFIQCLLGFGALDKLLRKFEGYGGVLSIAGFTFFLDFGVIIPYFIFGPYSGVSPAISFVAFFVFIIINAPLFYIYSRVRLNKRKH